MNFLLLKYAHIFSVAASFALFFLRGLWVLRAYPPAQERWTRILPHVVDAVLLLSAIAMLEQIPGRAWPGDWLTVKLALLVVYILAGLFALKWGRTTAQKVTAWVIALLIFLFITTISVLHHPLGILSVV